MEVLNLGSLNSPLHRTIECIDIFSLLVMKISPIAVENAVATLKGDAVATLWQRSPSIVTTSQSGNFIRGLRLFNIPSAKVMAFIRKLSLHGQ